MGVTNDEQGVSREHPGSSVSFVYSGVQQVIYRLPMPGFDTFIKGMVPIEQLHDSKGATVRHSADR